MSAFTRFIALFALYASVALVSYWSAWHLRFGFYADIVGIPEKFAHKMLSQGVYLLPLKLLFLYAFGQFNGLVRFFRMPDAVRLFAASSLFTFLGLATWTWTSTRFVPPASVLLVDFIVFTFTVMGARVGIRLLNERRKGFSGKARLAQRIAIVAAGQAGSSLAADLFAQPELGMRPVAFFDDDPSKSGRSLHALPVIGAPEEIPDFFKTHDLDKVILALPSAEPERIRELTLLLKRNHIPVETVPSLGKLLDGSRQAVQTREVRIEDLLYREPVSLDLERVGQGIKGRRVLVTGAGGSIGGELARQLSTLGPARLILLDRNEGALFMTEQVVREGSELEELMICVADLRDEAAVEKLLTSYKPEIIFHAAAHKHVGMMERQPQEAYLNNTMATLELARQAVQHQVSLFCLISTDKAVTPSSIMGASKRLAERGLQALVATGVSGETAFNMVRFGNVIGSSGSVIPIFEKQIAARKPVTVTDVEMTRYFMTIPEAAGLVLQAAAYGDEASLFTLEMGEPVRIDDVARDLIRLHGLEPDVDIPVMYSGRREGEKLHEELHYPEEVLEPTAHKKIHRVRVGNEPSDQANAFLQALDQLADSICEMNLSDAREQVFKLLQKSEG